MSCGQIALNRIGITPEVYYASELDKYAIKVTQANYPNTVQLGDVTQWREWGIDWASIDLLIGGSPCQGFSFAGKQLAFDDPRSKLFFVYVDILNHIKSVNPNVKFMLENVKMKKEYLAVISEQLGVEPVFINSALVSAQNRQRYYWCNWEVGKPEDKGVVLSDILESSVGAKYDLSDKLMNGFYNKKGSFNGRFKPMNPSVNQKSFCLTARYFKCGISDPYVLTEKSGGNHFGLSARKLTPIECERLQTVPDNYTNHVSNTQRYKMLGNGWTVDVIVHIFSQSLI